MKKLLLILLCLPLIGFGQLTMIPDANFEQELINLGYDNNLNGSVYTASIDTVTTLNLYSQNISNLTGIEDFTNLTYLVCGNNPFTNLDVSQNTALNTLFCQSNQLTSLNVSGATALEELYCNNNNQLTSLNVSGATALEYLDCNNNNQLTNLEVSGATALTNLSCHNNQLTSLDVSQNLALTSLSCNDNLISCLDVSFNLVLTNLLCNNNLIDQLNTKNGNWINNLYVNAISNNLLCAEVDNIGYATNNWLFDSLTSLNTNCNYSNPCNMTYGCTDVLACNYNPLATIDDSSCVYNYISTYIVTACDSYSWFDSSGDTIYTALNSNVLSGGGNGVYSVNGLYIDTVIYTNQGGCDSIVILNLFLSISTYSYDTISFLDSIIWNNLLVFTSGTYYSILINSGGCDSTAYLYAISSTTGISDIANSKSNLVKITDILGQETPYRRNAPLFYIYDDGTVEKRIVIE